VHKTSQPTKLSKWSKTATAGAGAAAGDANNDDVISIAATGDDTMVFEIPTDVSPEVVVTVENKRISSIKVSHFNAYNTR
jgi:hypothetical protein